MEMIDKYLDEVCGYIKNIPYRRTVRRELQNHLEDSMEYAGQNNSDREEAARRAIAEMGDARETGLRLDAHLSVRPNLRLILYIFVIFCLYTAASLNIDPSFPETILTLLAYGVCAVLFSLLRKTDLEGNSYLIKYLYFGTLFLLSATSLSADPETGKKCMSTGGIILFFCVAFFIYRRHKSDVSGLIAALGSFLLPIPLFLSVSAYAPLFLYIIAGLLTFVRFLTRGWKLNAHDRIFFCLCIAITVGIIGVLCGTSISLKRSLWNGFFLRDGLNHFPYLAQHFRTYPLAACMSRYGNWTAVLYLVVFSLLLAELIRMKRKVHYSWGRNMLDCIFLMLLLKGTFAVLLNLGVPLIRYGMLPFAGFGFDQISNFLLIVMAEYVYCFGDAVFGDHSFFEEQKC
ncbi:MAG: permease prefix domain 1-containing protein [Eubacterium sp.]|nr:permease prefix domain 1-containing protein [Eubacterium sp.]